MIRKKIAKKERERLNVLNKNEMRYSSHKNSQIKKNSETLNSKISETQLNKIPETKQQNMIDCEDREKPVVVYQQFTDKTIQTTDTNNKTQIQNNKGSLRSGASLPAIKTSKIDELNIKIFKKNLQNVGISHGLMKMPCVIINRKRPIKQQKAVGSIDIRAFVC